MRNRRVYLGLVCLALMTACSPRDFLTRRLATTLIATSETFNTPQQFWLRTGVMSNKDYSSPDYLVLQRRGWLTGASVPCSPDIAPPPCWDVALTPLGVEAFRGLVPNGVPVSQYFSVQTARRELIGITGVSKYENRAEVDFQWRWVPLNEVGTALSTSGLQYNSTVAFKQYDDGWRLVEGATSRSDQNLEEALKNAIPAP
jgi:hypothetical protein